MFGGIVQVIEAVPENLALKHKVIQQLEPHLKDTCVFATNTSALPIADIAKAAKRPENVVGMHYFSPVDKMPLLEVITHAGTSAEVGIAVVPNLLIVPIAYDERTGAAASLARRRREPDRAISPESRARQRQSLQRIRTHCFGNRLGRES